MIYVDNLHEFAIIPMLIRKAAIKAFLDRPRYDYRKYKKLSDADLEEMKAELPIRPPIWSKLDKHQKVCFLIGAAQRRFAFLLDTGMGKTMLSLALARYFEAEGSLRSGLVLVPNRANKEEWAREIEKHSPGLCYRILEGSSERKWKQLEDGRDCLLTIETYAGFIRMACELAPSKKKGKNKLKPSPVLVRRLVKQFDGLWLDESTSVKNHLALPYRICRQISKEAELCFALSGTPFGRNPADLWPQMFLIDGGHTLGETLGLFRAAFFSSKINYWGGSEHKFKKKEDDKLHRMLANVSIRYEPKETDLPALIPIKKYVDLSSEPQAYFDKARALLLSSHGNWQEQKNAFLRMRQISSGFLGYKDDDSGEKAQLEFDDNPKLNLLLSILETLTHKAIVFHEFLYSGRLICRELQEMGIGHRLLNGQTKDPKEALKAFDSDPKVRVLLLNNAAGGFGLNLQVAQYGIYYESPVSAIIRKQTRRRFERQHSSHDKVFQYDLLCRGTYDERILAFHKEGDDLFAAIVQGRAKP
jgi:SNF2 family DNA or RNA helicase